MFRRPTSRATIGGAKKIRRDGYSNDRTSWFNIRKEVFDRDQGLCRSRINGILCGKPGSDVHHVIPLSRGGTTTKANLITVCKACHDRRHPDGGGNGKAQKRNRR